MKRRAILAALLICGAAAADVRGTWPTQTGQINLHDDAGPCVDRALRAEYVSAIGGQNVSGCWITGGGVVRVVFMDGDVVQVPVAVVHPPRSV